MEFWRFYRVIRQRRQVIVAVMVAAVIVALVVGQRKMGDYSSTVTLTIPTEQQFFFVSSADTTGSQAPSSDALSGLATDLIRSREVADRVIQQLHVNLAPDQLENQITVVRDPDTSQVRITAQAANPGDAVALANAVADNAASYYQEVQRRQATLAREFVERQTADTQDRLQAAENALLAYQQKNGTVMATGSAAQVGNLQAEIQQTDFDLQAANARVDSLSTQMNSQAATRTDQYLFQNPVAQQLEAQLVQLQVALTSQLAVHTENYPSVVSIEAMIKEIKDRLNTEVSKSVATQQVVHNPVYDALTQERVAAETDVLALQAKKQALSGALGSATQTLPAAAQTQLDATRLTRGVSILGQELTDLSNQLGQARLREQEVQSLGALSVLDHARVAVQSPFAGLRFKLTLGLVLGLLGGLSLAFFLEYLDNSLKTTEAAERLVGVPALVAIPRHNPPFDEAYRMLRVNLASHEHGVDGADVVMLTASRPRSGTSTVVLNLARAFSRAGRRVIVVDAAMARPVQHTLFDVPNTRGLAQVLAGASSVDDALMPAGQNILVMPAVLNRAGRRGRPARLGRDGAHRRAAAEPRGHRPDGHLPGRRVCRCV